MDGAVGPSRSGTLRKKGSFRRQDSLKRSASRRSMRNQRPDGDGTAENDFNNVFSTPIPTSGNPTEVLANRFQAWRKLLKDLVNYFREIQTSYEARSKAILKIANVLNNTSAPSIISSNGGLDDAARILRGFHKQALNEANKAKDIEEDVITQLNGLRSDLNQKIKEIKSLAGDFKNSVDREKEGTRRAVGALHDAIATAEHDPAGLSGKTDPFVMRLAVERQVEKQIDEENYLHRAYLNLEGSGRELESIVVGEVQKAYNAYAGILKREADQAHDTSDTLRSGPIAMAKDHEWSAFVHSDPHFVNPDLSPRRLQDIYFPGKYAALATEIRGGMLERKSKYLKSYTAGWYVLTPTHLHEFKSADHIHTQTPVMSLSLLEQRLGSRSAPDASSHKFSLKGRQSGSMHRGHSWVFRAESHDTMMAWYDDIRVLTEKSSQERAAFVRKHVRSVSGGNSKPASLSSDGLEEDEADAVPFSANNSSIALDGIAAGGVAAGAAAAPEEATPKRPEPGGRFPSDIVLTRRLYAPDSHTSGSSDNDNDAGALAGASPSGRTGSRSAAAAATTNTTTAAAAAPTAVPIAAAAKAPVTNHSAPSATELPVAAATPAARSETAFPTHEDTTSAAGVGAGVAGGLVAGAALESYADNHHLVAAAHTADQEDTEPSTAPSATIPIVTTTNTLGVSEDSPAISPADVERTDSSFGAATTTASTARTSVEGVPDATAKDTLEPPHDDADTISELSDVTESGLPTPTIVGPPTGISEVSASELHVPGEFPPTPAAV